MSEEKKRPYYQEACQEYAQRAEKRLKQIMSRRNAPFFDESTIDLKQDPGDIQNLSMNVVIAICYYCEFHGPKVLFCTEAFHDTEETHWNQVTGENAKSKTESWYGPSFITLTSASSDSPVKSNLCQGCTSMTTTLSSRPITEGFVDTDHEARVSYASSQYPLRAEVFKIVNHACIRSLIYEVFPGRLPLIFGDDRRGHVLSQTFLLKDSQARRFQSMYSIIIVMRDKIALRDSYPFLKKNFMKIIHELQEKANKVYSAEQPDTNLQARLNSVTWSKRVSFQRGRENIKARSLIDLTNDKNIFFYLHQSFTGILKAGNVRNTERLVKSCTSEDPFIGLERQEETEEGFVKVHLTKSRDSVPERNYKDENLQLPEENHGVTASVPEMNNKDENLQLPEENHGVTASVSEMNNEDENLQLPEENHSVTASVPEMSNEDENLQLPKKNHGVTAAFPNIRVLYQILGKEKFHCLAYHTFVGNQIIIISKYLSLVTSMIDCLKDLLPRGCCHPIHYSETYEDSRKCNFLGITPDVEIPDHVKTSEFHIQVRITSKTEDVRNNSLEDFEIVFHTTAVLPDGSPQILNEMERAIADTSISLTGLENFLVTNKEIWLNKMKHLLFFANFGPHGAEGISRLFTLFGAEEQVEQVFKFWTTGVQTHSEDQNSLSGHSE